MMRDGNAAVFCRNHAKYLEKAARIGERIPGEPITFRAKKQWTSAARAVRRYGPRPIYFAVIGAGPVVLYVASLEDLELTPSRGASRTEELLAHCLEETKKEALWDGQVRTLYLIRGCKRLGSPLPMERLKKLADGRPMSPAFRYSYALVQETEVVPSNPPMQPAGTAGG